MFANFKDLELLARSVNVNIFLRLAVVLTLTLLVKISRPSKDAYFCVNEYFCSRIGIYVLTLLSFLIFFPS